MNRTMDSKTRTPKEKLIFEKERVRLQCLDTEEALCDHLGYIQGHAGSLLLSGISGLFFPKTKTSTKKTAVASQHAGEHESAVSHYLALAKDLLPGLMDIAKPLLFTWGLKNARKWIFRLIRGK